jgi:hypothetical protein
MPFIGGRGVLHEGFGRRVRATEPACPTWLHDAVSGVHHSNGEGQVVRHAVVADAPGFVLKVNSSAIAM